ncbi:bifunctional demethylmenaquinone methyltransferase/2-methoxy-6-polyprenyl-1,4-benzoquinol methylase UbiE [Aureisphaera galaxeae]|uniref:bifunctional demethylmenaquinone methyltransferase/2-methoxy-6-polyprenyl-1,4-benzoquinol methylase UbiE n=1 Tax=Aureisphaera galaxeae TaxID=1538023 RepID=UPI00235085AC|nr:bifunctional demethylmenaquinone methyltransferase/2-methoxy-6-polyprenyl-1,4-benzoquinol methylase UbiE [Aureisphaera galaxeae]MDC8003249.1 bifunctional demethylmenaquinone methyltransferase/2-methoxy-6-polyprenyl-1,4-benzoquinol methylase UbiE [Aureisphaera galaxeae]
MSKQVTPYKDAQGSKKEQVEQMFDTISGNYDGLNRVISLGSDVKWRKKVVRMIAEGEPKSILDIATGTGDLALQFSKKIPQAKVVGLDLSEGMLSVARKKATGASLNVSFVKGDSEALPFEDNSFDAITVSFGIRNFENLEKGLSEILRVLAPKGKFIILETSVPTRFPWKQGYYMYTKGIMPVIGKLFSKDKVAYKYLSESASVFPFGEKLNNILRKIGFIEVENKPQTLGVATIYTATK